MSTDSKGSIRTLVLGHGSMSTVVFAGVGAGTGLAYKRIQKDHEHSETLYRWYKTEKAMLETSGKALHKNIVKLYGAHEDEKFYWLVTELCSGVELLKAVLTRGKFPEQLTGTIMHEIFSAVKHLHERGIVHRDIKPHNVIIDISEDDAINSIKIIDFGLARRFSLTHPEPFHTMVGTAHYMAPEVILCKYWSNCDEWSCGIIAYFLLSGYPPYLGREQLDVFKSILRDEYSFRPKHWGNISEEAKDFIRRLLIKDTERMTAAEALMDPWLRKSGV